MGFAVSELIVDPGPGDVADVVESDRRGNGWEYCDARAGVAEIVAQIFRLQSDSAGVGQVEERVNGQRIFDAATVGKADFGRFEVCVR